MSSEYQNNSLAGVFAALTSLVAGHPFDTVTVRMQSSSTNYRSSLHCLTETVKSDGALALYRGFVPELFSRSTTSAMRFTVQAAMNKQVAAQIVQHQGGSQAAVFKDLPLRWRATSEAMGGAACGVVLPLIFTPAELIKCKKQVLPLQSNFSILKGVLKAGGSLLLFLLFPLNDGEQHLAVRKNYERRRQRVESYFVDRLGRAVRESLRCSIF